MEWGKVKNHPVPVSFETYAGKLDRAIADYGFEQIFLASDSEDAVAYFQEKYPDMVVFYDDMARARRGSAVMALFDDGIDRDGGGFRLGYEVLQDMLTISFCDGIVGGLSYVSFAAEVFKRSRGETYQYKDFVDMSISRKGIMPIKFARKTGC